MMSWFEEEGWFYDKRDHMWKKVKGGKELSKRENVIKHTQGINSETSVSDSKPFTKTYTLSIFNNQQYPLKFHEDMFKK